MSSWGAQRRSKIILSFFIIVLLIIVLILTISLHEDPTCFDGKKNGGESGVDCGGGCELLCRGQAINPLVHWARSFEVAPGIYNSVAYLENLNTEAGSPELEYIFKYYNQDNVLVAEKEGSINLRPKEIIPVVQNSINVGKQKINRTTFTVTNLDTMTWTKQSLRERSLVISDEELFEVDGLPRISAEVTNISINTVEKIRLIVIVYDVDGNAINTSSTIIQRLPKDQTEEVIYTWPKQFSKEASSFEIIPLYDSIN
jgi:hypothetical protein